MRLEDYEEKKRSRLPRWLQNLTDLILIVCAFLGFAAFAILVLPHAPKWVAYIVYPIGVLMVGSFVRGLAKEKKPNQAPEPTPGSVTPRAK